MVFTHRNYSKTTDEALINHSTNVLNNLNKLFLLHPEFTINEKFNLLNKNLNEIINECYPVKTFSKREIRLRSKPWITKAIMRSIKTRNKMYKKLIKTNYRDKDLHTQYKKYRNNLTKIKETSKKNYYENLLKNAQGNTRKTWEVINKVINKRKKGHQLPSELKINNNVIKEPADIINNLNAYFSTIGEQNCNTQNDYNEISKTLNFSQKNSFVWVDTTGAEISKIISHLDTKKATGPDEVSVRIIKTLNHLISPILSSLINDCFQAGLYPDYLKAAQVTPLYKGGDKSLPENYRPISVLSIINKIFEKIIYLRLHNFLEKYSIIHPNQFGFRHGYSTSMAISEFYEKLLESSDENKGTCAILLDLKKAFDSVDRQILLFKLKSYGIRGNMWNLIKSYLSNRTQFIKNGVLKSNLNDVNVGVPQGSVLGPLLFILLLNDLKFCTTLNSIIFADDTLLYFSFKNPTNMVKIINSELAKVDKWLSNNNLKINTSKTKVMTFFPKNKVWRNIPKLSINIDKSQELELVSEYKYLGLIIDSKLNWSNHINYLKLKLSKALGMLFRTRYFLNLESRIIIFQSLFISHLNYGLLNYGRCSNKYIEPLNKLLNKSLRCIHFCGYKENVLKYYVKHNILKVQDMYRLELGKFMFKYKKGLLPINFINYFSESNKSHKYETRFSKDNYVIPQKNKSVGLTTLGYQGAKLWSEIPGSLKACRTVQSFSRLYKAFLLEQYA